MKIFSCFHCYFFVCLFVVVVGIVVVGLFQIFLFCILVNMLIKQSVNFIPTFTHMNASPMYD